MANIFLRQFFTSRSPLIATTGRLFSTTSCTLSNSSSQNKNEDKVVMTDDGRVIVCWHPEVPFPYECSKPITPDAVVATESALKIQSLEPVQEVYRKKFYRLVVKELRTMTFTPQGRWYPRKRRMRYADMHPLKEKRDREFL